MLQGRSGNLLSVKKRFYRELQLSFHWYSIKGGQFCLFTEKSHPEARKQTVTLTELIQSYGYIAVFVGTFLEGETILLLAGFAAHRGYLSLPGVMAIACLASFMGDQFYFFLGRRYGNRLTGRFPGLNKRVERFRRLLDLYHVPVILSLRFLYGLRIAGPIALGMTEVSWLRYLILNLLGAVVWAILIAGLGYVFGNAMTLLLGELRQYEGWAFLALLTGGSMLWLVHIIREWRKRENQT